MTLLLRPLLLSLPLLLLSPLPPPTLQGWCFGVMGQRLATRVRVLMLQALLRQDISFFDRPENSSGQLMAALSADATTVRGAVGDRLGHLVTIFSCIIASYVIALKSR